MSGESVFNVKASHSDTRRAERLDLEFPAMLREAGMTKFQVKVKDLSVTGFRCETSFTMNPGTPIWLTIPGLSGLEATVAWKDGFKYGFAFRAPLHVAIFEHVMRQFGGKMVSGYQSL
jgi:PilZ domain